MVTIENTIPVLGVADVDASIRFFTQVLCFEHDWGGGQIASVGCDGHPIMLSQSDKPGGAQVWVGCEDALELFKTFTSRGAEVVQVPTNEGHALEMRINDLDGNVLWFGSEPLNDVPYGEPVPVD